MQVIQGQSRARFIIRYWIANIWWTIYDILNGQWLQKGLYGIIIHCYLIITLNINKHGYNNMTLYAILGGRKYTPDINKQGYNNMTLYTTLGGRKTLNNIIYTLWENETTI